MGTGRNGNIPEQYNKGAVVPDALKKLRGTYNNGNANLRARKMGADSAEDLMPGLEVTADFAEAPASLSTDYAVQEWNEYIKPLMEFGVIAMTDIRSAEIYCELWGQYLAMKDRLKDRQNYPDAVFSLELVDRLTKIMNTMGMTPVSRCKVVMLMKQKKQVKTDDWADILQE